MNCDGRGAGPDWLARKKQTAAPSSWRMFESAYRVHVMPRWGAVSVADVNVLGVEIMDCGHGPRR